MKRKRAPCQVTELLDRPPSRAMTLLRKKRSEPRPKLSSARLAVWVFALLGALAIRPSFAAEVDCRELEQNYTQAKVGVSSIQLNRFLFASAAKDCGALARRLIAAGASLMARD